MRPTRKKKIVQCRWCTDLVVIGRRMIRHVGTGNVLCESAKLRSHQAVQVGRRAASDLSNV